MLKKRYAALQDRVDALSLRERAIIFVAVAAMMFILWDKVFMVAQEERQQELLRKIQSVRDEISVLDEQSLAIMEKHNIDPNTPELAQIDNLEKQLQDTSDQINSMIKGLIEPKQMAVILENVLKKQHGLKFVSLEKLGSEALVDVQNEKSGATAPGIYKHIMRLELEGSYSQTLAYLQALETLPWQFRWNEVKITMDKYPRASVVITVHTISLQEGWVGV